MARAHERAEKARNDDGSSTSGIGSVITKSGGIGPKFGVWDNAYITAYQSYLADPNSSKGVKAWAQYQLDNWVCFVDAAGNLYSNAQVWDARNPKPPVERKKVQ